MFTKKKQCSFSVKTMTKDDKNILLCPFIVFDKIYRANKSHHIAEIKNEIPCEPKVQMRTFNTS